MKPNQPKFEAESYSKNRPFYPHSVFSPLAGAAGTYFLDLGCGTGHSTASFLDFNAVQGLRFEKGFAIDPSSTMLEKAERSLAGRIGITFQLGSAENIPMPAASVDLVLVGSAFHWFTASKAISELERVLKPGGLLYIFEYQFPKSVNDPSLHEAVKRRFNLEWKAPLQKPRGTLADLTADLRQSSVWKLIADHRPEWKEKLTLEAFLGHLYSQSRYLHAEASQTDVEAYRAEIEKMFQPFFASGPLEFDLKPRSVLFKSTRGIK